MIEYSVGAWGLLAAFLLVSLLASHFLSRALPWTISASQAGLPAAVAFAIAPFLVGFSGVLALGLLPEASHLQHRQAAFAFLVLISLSAWGFGRRQCVEYVKHRYPYEGLHLILVAVLGIWLFALALNTLFLPLMQNDALEYATVGRVLFESRTLESYPVLDAEATASGFYGPWTHPPLYVGFIYLVSNIQGHVNEPGLMRLIAPWFAAGVVFLTFALGNLVNRLVGLLAALTCISAPLFFFGADSALIDALPVLGLILVVAMVVGIQQSPLVRGCLIGIALGVALWTHSQAVLFVPLTGVAILLWYGELRWRSLIVEGATVLTWAVIIGGWPYYRNIAIFGSPISDNPAVFALPVQAWTDYFTIGRGLDNWSAIIQYGWFKGWFAPEAFGVAFWLALPGLAYAAKNIRGTTFFYTARSHSKNIELKALSRVMFGVLGVYFIGVIFSTLIGTELMIKNERYLLVMLPFIGFASGTGLAIMLGEWSFLRKGRELRRIFLGVMILGFSSLCLVLTGYRFYVNGVSIDKFGQSFSNLLLSRSEYLSIKYISESLPESALVFSLKPADMYYSDRKMLSYLDPRLLEFYKSADLLTAFAELKKVGVTHVHVPDYGLPPLYNSFLQEILSRPSFADLMFFSEGHQVYKLLDGDSKVDMGVSPRLAVSGRWSQMRTLVLGGRKGTGTFAYSPQPYNLGDLSIGGLSWGGFHRDLTKILVAGSDKDIQITGGQEYLLELLTQGRGFVRVWLRQYDAYGWPLKAENSRSTYTVRIGEYVVGDVYPKKRFSRRIVTLPLASRVEVLVEHLGTSYMIVQDFSLTPISGIN